jgi:hypothetical protein
MPKGRGTANKTTRTQRHQGPLWSGLNVEMKASGGFLGVLGVLVVIYFRTGPGWNRALQEKPKMGRGGTRPSKLNRRGWRDGFHAVPIHVIQIGPGWNRALQKNTNGSGWNPALIQEGR